MFNIHVSKEVLQIFNSFKQLDRSDTEACGLLIGTHSIDGKLITIKSITIPGKKDIRKRYSYKIKSKHHVEALKKSFECSNFKEVYLGTWHTHPEDIPTLSSEDISDWKKQYQKNKHLFEKMIFIIVGRKTILCWSLNKDEKFKLKTII
ncbi:MAG: Mov34/MPN/PAD-1 family protein [Fusobacteriaceae bacterium]